MKNEIIKMLFEAEDSNYKEFHSRLMPNIAKEKIIGVRIPQIRKLAKELSNSSLAEEFINSIPHYYYEENNLHAFLIAEIKDYDECVKAVDKFLPFVDNWATCDSLRPKVFAKNKFKLLEKIKSWLSSNDTYTVRFGIEMLMVHFLGDDFNPLFSEWVASIESDEYYIMMMKAWYFATAMIGHYEEIVALLEQKRLDKVTHNKTISKAVESYRISDEKKKYLKSLRVV